MEELADDSKFHHQSLDVDYEVSIYHPSRLARRQRRIAHPNISTLNFLSPNQTIGKKKHNYFFWWLFPATLLKKKRQAEKIGSSSPKSSRGEDPERSSRSFWAGLRFPKKMPLIHHNDIASSFRKGDPGHPPTPPKKNTTHKLLGRKWSLGMPKGQNGPKKGAHLLLGEKSFGVCLFESKRLVLNWCNLQASPLFISKFPLQKQKKLDKFPPIKGSKTKVGKLKGYLLRFCLPSGKLQ